MKVVLLALLIALGVAVPAEARFRTIAPPGNSGVGQYVETLPTAGGSRPTNTVHPVAGGSHGGGGGGSIGGGGGGGGGSIGGGSGGGTSGGGTSAGSSSVSSPTLHALAAHGSDGAKAAALVRATAPRGVQPESAKPANRQGSSASTASNGSGPSPVGSLLKAVTGSTSNGGLGPLLPVILIGSLFLAAALVLVRRRTH